MEEKWRAKLVNLVIVGNGKRTTTLYLLWVGFLVHVKYLR